MLRLGPGDALEAVDPQGAAWRLTIQRVDPARCIARAEPAAAGGSAAAGGGAADDDAAAAGGGSPGTSAAGASPALVLMACLPKAAKMDLIVRQAVEAGAARIVPLVSDRTVVRPEVDGTRAGRWRRIAREAREQSGAREVAIEPPVPLDEAVARPRAGTAVFFHEERAGAEGLHAILAGADLPVTVLVGPEGGLSPREVALLAAAGFRRAWLGEGVLRAETAALYALAAVGTILRERDTWKPSREG